MTSINDITDHVMRVRDILHGCPRCGEKCMIVTEVGASGCMVQLKWIGASYLTKTPPSIEAAAEEGNGKAEMEHINDQRNAMMKYQKKPIIIEAVQYTKDNLQRVYNFFRGTVYDEKLFFSEFESFKQFTGNGHNIFKMITLEGSVNVAPNDWIIKGVKGELYPCKPDVFELTYTKVEQ